MEHMQVARTPHVKSRSTRLPMHFVAHMQWLSLRRLHHSRHSQLANSAELKQNKWSAEVSRMKTRAKRTATSTAKSLDEVSEVKAMCLDNSTQVPPRIFILPKDTSISARIVTIGMQSACVDVEVPNRYLACPDKGFYEITKIVPSKKSCYSWLMTPAATKSQELAEPEDLTQVNIAKGNAQNDEVEEGYLLATPDMFVATAVDPLFIMLSLEGILWHGDLYQTTEYLALSDRTRTLKMRIPHLRQLLEDNPGSHMERMLEERTKEVCDELAMGDDEAMYSFSITKLAQTLLKKAEHMVKVGLPTSMEEHFVKRVLEVPILSIRREDSSVSIIAGDAEVDSQSASVSQDTNKSMPAIASISTNATSITSSQERTTTDVSHLLRLRTALQHIQISYIPHKLRSRLDQIYASQNAGLVDFAPLDKHLAHIASLKTQAQALRTISDNVSRKRGLMDDEEALEKAEAKKRKREEEEARKKNVSHGVKKLMKADTSGMKKLSSFFTKGTAAKKS